MKRYLSSNYSAQHTSTNESTEPSICVTPRISKRLSASLNRTCQSSISRSLPLKVTSIVKSREHEIISFQSTPFPGSTKQISWIKILAPLFKAGIRFRKTCIQYLSDCACVSKDSYWHRSVVSSRSRQKWIVRDSHYSYPRMPTLPMKNSHAQLWKTHLKK